MKRILFALVVSMTLTQIVQASATRPLSSIEQAALQKKLTARGSGGQIYNCYLVLNMTEEEKQSPFFEGEVHCSFHQSPIRGTVAFKSTKTVDGKIVDGEPQDVWWIDEI